MKLFGVLKRWQSNWGIIYVSDGLVTTKFFLHEINIQSGRDRIAFGAGVRFDTEPPRRPQELARAINAEVGEVIAMYRPKPEPANSSSVQNDKGGAL